MSSGLSGGMVGSGVCEKRMCCLHAQRGETLKTIPYRRLSSLWDHEVVAGAIDRHCRIVIPPCGRRLGLRRVCVPYKCVRRVIPPQEIWSVLATSGAYRHPVTFGVYHDEWNVQNGSWHLCSFSREERFSVYTL